MSGTEAACLFVSYLFWQTMTTTIMTTRTTSSTSITTILTTKITTTHNQTTTGQGNNDCTKPTKTQRRSKGDPKETKKSPKGDQNETQRNPKEIQRKAVFRTMKNVFVFLLLSLFFSQGRKLKLFKNLLNLNFPLIKHLCWTNIY